MADEPGAAPALKEIFNRERFTQIATEAGALSADFDIARFISVATQDLDEIGIMQRMRQGAVALHEALRLEYPQAIAVLNHLAPRIKHNFAAIMLPEFVALFGLEHFDLSLNALKYYTRFGSSEFAIRTYLKQDFDKTLSVMRGWTDDENEHVRRLASEGSRPRLPWSFQLKPVIENPEPTWPILDALKADPSLYVRKSVANHLNDIGKDHPDWLLNRLTDWPKDNRETAWIVKHALRTLIKKGDQRALALIGTTGDAKVTVERFEVSPAVVRLGSHVSISAAIISTSNASQRLVADYAVHYVKSSGAASRKVFKLKEFDLPAAGRQALSIKRAIRDFTTRKHYAGHHRVELIINGKAVAESGFELTA